MTVTSTTTRRPRRRITSMLRLCAILLVAMLSQSFLVDLFDAPMLRTGSTVFIAVVVQALPFLVLGALLSGARVHGIQRRRHEEKDNAALRQRQGRRPTLRR